MSDKSCTCQNRMLCSHEPEISRHPHAKEIRLALAGEETEAQGVEISRGSHSADNSNRT